MKQITKITIEIDPAIMEGEFDDVSRMGKLVGEIEEMAKNSFGHNFKGMKSETSFEEDFV